MSKRIINFLIAIFLMFYGFSGKVTAQVENAQPVHLNNAFITAAPTGFQQNQNIVSVITQGVYMVSPNGGEKIALDGSEHKITFSTNLSSNNDGKYEFQLELWRNDKKVGNINPKPQVFSLKSISNGYGMPRYRVGVYYLEGESLDNYHVADPGKGYRIKVVAYLDGKVVAEDESDGDFIFIPGPELGEVETTLIKPNGGETYEIGKDAVAEFSYKGLDPYKLSQYDVGLELWRNGKKIGTIVPRQPMNGNGSKMSLSLNIGTYQDESLKAVKAEAGDGYTYRVIIFKGDYAIAHDDSDSSFSFEESKTEVKKTNPLAAFLNGIISWFKSLFTKIGGLFKR